MSAELRAEMAVSMKQIYPRSHGVQLFRDYAHAMCSAYLNNASQDYFDGLRDGYRITAEVVKLEILHPQQIVIDANPAPVLAPSKPGVAGAPATNAQGGTPQDTASDNGKKQK